MAIYTQTFYALLAIAASFSAQADELGSVTPAAQFSSARIDYPWSFPRDHGSHPDFETEWWYFTGHLAEPGSDIFDDGALGFQLTFFRRAESAQEGIWNQSYLAHAALSNFGTSQRGPLAALGKEPWFIFRKFLSRSALGVAGAERDTLRVWNQDFRAEKVGESIEISFSVARGETLFEVQLSASQSGPPLLQGKSGFSQKGACIDCASQYYSLPRLKLSGQIRFAGSTAALEGLGWMDHEFMSKALSKKYSGWDWFSLMGRDGTDIMLFKLRGISGEADYYTGMARRADKQIELNSADISISEDAILKSPHTKAKYPSRWKVHIPRLGIDESIVPRVSDQELYPQENLSASSGALSYWEGAVRSESGAFIGYVELTGYDKPLNQIF